MTETRLKIAMTSYYLPSESKIGVGYVAHRLAQVLCQQGHDVTIFSPCRKPDDARYQHEHVALSGSLRSFRWARLVKKLDLSAYDVLHAHSDNHFRSRKSHPPVVQTMHGSCFVEALHIRGLKERLRMSLLGLAEVLGSIRATRVVAVSWNTCRVYPWIRTVIPNGVDLDLFRPGEKAQDPTVLFVGTYRRRKRGRLLMEVFERDVRSRIPGAQLWMVCSDAPAAAAVSVLGRLSDEDLADLYRRAWLFCLPSSYEGFGVPYVEAMASGTAVIATLNPGAREVVGQAGGGVIVPDRLLGPTIIDLLSDESTRNDLATQGKRNAVQYGWDKVSAAYLEQYRLARQQRIAAP